MLLHAAREGTAARGGAGGGDRGDDDAQPRRRRRAAAVRAERGHRRHRLRPARPRARDGGAERRPGRARRGRAPVLPGRARAGGGGRSGRAATGATATSPARTSRPTASRRRCSRSRTTRRRRAGCSSRCRRTRGRSCRPSSSRGSSSRAASDASSRDPASRCADRGAPRSPAAAASEQADLLVTAPRLFDGERLIRDGAVAIRGDEIVAAGRREDVDVDAARTIALRDATLLPGLDRPAYARARLRPCRFGRDDRPRPRHARRNLPLQEQPSGPRVLVAGPLITAPGGYPIPIHGPASRTSSAPRTSARRYVRSLADRGAGVIKVSLQFGLPVITFATLRAIVEEAHAHDLRVTAHVGEGRGARMALRAGVDELAHMPCGEDPELMGELADAGMEIVATLHVIRLTVGCPGLLENATSFHRRGGTLLYGSDYGVTGIPTGVVVTSSSCSPEAGLGTARRAAGCDEQAADVLAIDGLGRLAEGSPADFAAVRGDPTQTSTRSPSRCSSSAAVRSRSAADAYTRRRGDDRDRHRAARADGGALREARARVGSLALPDRPHRRRRAADRLGARVRVVARLPGGSVLPGRRRALVDRVRQPGDGALPDRALAGRLDLLVPHARPRPLGALAGGRSPSSARSRRRRSAC